MNSKAQSLNPVYLSSVSLAIGKDYTPPDFALLTQLQEMIEKNYRLTHDLQFYAEGLHITLYRLNSLTKFYLKRTVYELLQERIHEQAKILLKTTTLSCRQISFELGVCDPSYFSKCFAKMEGVNPKDFRKKCLKFAEVA